GAEEGKELLESSIADSALFQPQIYDRPASPQFTPLFQGQKFVQPPLQTSPATIVEEPPALGDLAGRVIGQYRMSYVLIDTPGGLRLIDQHAAHERVLYDRYIERIERRDAISQQLLTPMLFESGAAESAVLESHSDELRAVAFEIERAA